MDDPGTMMISLGIGVNINCQNCSASDTVAVVGQSAAGARVLIAKEHLFATQQVGKQNMFLGEPDVAEINLFPIAARVFKCRRAGDACRALPLELCTM